MGDVICIIIKGTHTERKGNAATGLISQHSRLLKWEDLLILALYN